VSAGKVAVLRPREEGKERREKWATNTGIARPRILGGVLEISLLEILI
jgi:hypothetical protein